LELALTQAQLNVIGCTSISSGEEAAILGGRKDIEKNGESRTTKASGGQLDAAAVELEGDISKREITFNAVGLNTAGVDKGDAQQKEGDSEK